MGYYIYQEKSEFRIDRTQKKNVLSAIQSLQGKETCGDHFAFVDPKFYRLKTLHSILREWRWQIENDLHGNVVKIKFTGEKAGDEDILFKAIAPFVQAGSFIEMFGEDGVRWRYEFDGMQCIQVPC